MKEELKNQTAYMLNGSLWDKIIKFAMPLALSSILQQLFNSADVAVAGNFAGKDALAAVGANAPVINLFINLLVGLSVGANVVIAIGLGSDNKEKVKRAVHTSIILALVGGLLLTIVGVILARPILELISTPNDILALAVRYLKIYFLGMPFIMLYNFEAAILRSKGDTKRPLFALSAAGIINVILNLFFVIICGMNVEGVAIATVISNVISSSVLFISLLKENSEIKVRIKDLRIDIPTLAEIAKIGFPAGLQGMVFSFSNICIQSALNVLGKAVIAATSAALNFEYYAYYVVSAFGQSCVTFIGQNYGAGKYNRCKSVIKWCFLLGGLFTVIVCGIFIVFSEFFVGIFTPDPEVIKLAALRVQIILALEVVNMTIELLSGALRGMGRSLVPAIICVVGICGTRVLWVYTVFKSIGTFRGLLIVYPISWIITAIVMIVAFMMITNKVFKQGKDLS